MKTLIFLAVIAIVRATVIPVAPVAVAVGETGESAQFRSEDNIGNYNFGYNEDHTSGGTFRREVGDAHGNVAGSYGLRDADGRVRIVNYVANDDGFKADIQTNEPGVEPKDPADATINKAESVILQSVVPAPVVAAPAPLVAIPHAEPLLRSAHVQQVAVSEPVSYVFPPASPVPVAKTVSQPIAYSFPEPAPVPVAKSVSTVTTSHAAPFVPAPLTKSSTTVTTSHVQPLTYAFPEPAAVPVAKTISAPVLEPQPVAYTFPARAAVPLAKSSLTYTSPAVVGGLSPLVTAPRLAYSQVHVANAPAHYAVNTLRYAPGAVSYSAPFQYAVAPHGHLGAYRYTSPYYRSLYSPVVSSFAGPVPYFNNIAYNGYPIVKK